MDFSLLRTSEFFVFRKMKMPETINHPLCGCATKGNLWRRKKIHSHILKYYRQRKQTTTRQLAEKLDIVPSTVAMYENVTILIITILIIVILILSFPIWNGTGMIRCNITNIEAAVCLYCRKFFAISYKSVIDKH